MAIKNNNEITLKVTCTKDDLINILIKKGFKIKEEFTLNDYYFIPNDLDIKIKILEKY